MTYLISDIASSHNFPTLAAAIPISYSGNEELDPLVGRPGMATTTATSILATGPSPTTVEAVEEFVPLSKSSDRVLLAVGVRLKGIDES